MLKAGDKAPDFTCVDHDGKTVRLSDFNGKTVVLYFYPKDMTPGCTREACDFSEKKAQFTKQGVVILGASPDSTSSHQKFREKEGLTIALLSDEDKSIAKAYEVWKQKTNYGKTYMGIERTTFVINPDGRIKTIFPRVTVDGHWDEVLKEVTR